MRPRIIIGVAVIGVAAVCLIAVGFTPVRIAPSALTAPHPSSPLSRYLNASAWNILFPHRYALNTGGGDFYSFRAFKAAAEKFPAFLSETDTVLQKRELAAFLANMAQETSGDGPRRRVGILPGGCIFSGKMAASLH